MLEMTNHEKRHHRQQGRDWRQIEQDDRPVVEPEVVEARPPHPVRGYRRMSMILAMMALSGIGTICPTENKGESR